MGAGGGGSGFGDESGGNEGGGGNDGSSGGNTDGSDNSGGGYSAGGDNSNSDGSGGSYDPGGGSDPGFGGGDFISNSNDPTAGQDARTPSDFTGETSGSGIGDPTGGGPDNSGGPEFDASRGPGGFGSGDFGAGGLGGNEAGNFTGVDQSGPSGEPSAGAAFGGGAPGSGPAAATLGGGFGGAAEALAPGGIDDILSNNSGGILGAVQQTAQQPNTGWADALPVGSELPNQPASTLPSKDPQVPSEEGDAQFGPPEQFGPPTPQTPFAAPGAVTSYQADQWAASNTGPVDYSKLANVKTGQTGDPYTSQQSYDATMAAIRDPSPSQRMLGMDALSGTSYGPGTPYAERGPAREAASNLRSSDWASRTGYGGPLGSSSAAVGPDAAPQQMPGDGSAPMGTTPETVDTFNSLGINTWPGPEQAPGAPSAPGQQTGSTITTEAKPDFTLGGEQFGPPESFGPPAPSGLGPPSSVPAEAGITGEVATGKGAEAFGELSAGIDAFAGGTQAAPSLASLGGGASAGDPSIPLSKGGEQFGPAEAFGPPAPDAAPVDAVLGQPMGPLGIEDILGPIFTEQPPEMFDPPSPIQPADGGAVMPVMAPPAAPAPPTPELAAPEAPPYPADPNVQFGPPHSSPVNPPAPGTVGLPDRFASYSTLSDPSKVSAWLQSQQPGTTVTYGGQSFVVPGYGQSINVPMLGNIGTMPGAPPTRYAADPLGRPGPAQPVGPDNAPPPPSDAVKLAERPAGPGDILGPPGAAAADPFSPGGVPAAAPVSGPPGGVPASSPAAAPPASASTGGDGSQAGGGGGGGREGGGGRTSPLFLPPNANQSQVASVAQAVKAANPQLTTQQAMQVAAFDRDLTNQWMQILIDQGSSDPVNSPAWPQARAIIGQQVNARFGLKQAA